MNRVSMQDQLVKLFLLQTQKVSSKYNPSYFRIMEYFNKESDLTIKHLYNYIKKSPMCIGQSLTDLYTGESLSRQKEFWDKRKRELPNIHYEEPYSVDMLFALN